MKTRRLAILASACVSIGLALYMHSAQANQSDESETNPPRLIDFLPMGSVIDLSFSNGLTQVKILGDKEVESFQTEATRLTEAYEELKKNDAASSPERENKIAEIKRSLNRRSTPWKVVSVGENYVRLKPIVRLPLHENTPWIILPESSITYIKPN